MQVSGNASFISHAEAMLPRRDLHVLGLAGTQGAKVDPDALAAVIRRRLVAFDAGDTVNEAVLALGWDSVPSHERITGLIAARLPVYVVLEGVTEHWRWRRPAQRTRPGQRPAGD